MRPALILVVALVLVGCAGSPGPVPSPTGAPDSPVAPRSQSPSTPEAVPPAAAYSPQIATPTPMPRPAILPGEPWLAFQSDAGGGTYGVRLVRPDGSDLFFPTRTAEGREQLHPDWSPDGGRLVFSTMGAVARDLWITDADGSNPDHIVVCDTCSEADEPAWSPDGASIAFHRTSSVDGKETSTLEILDLATRRSRVVLTAAPDRAFYAPRWSPDGKRIVAEYLYPGGGELVTVDLTAPDPTPVPITERSYWPANPDWSPDGKRIVFFRPVDPAKSDAEADLWTINPDGTDLTRLTQFADEHALAIHPTYTPDGTRIVFVTGKAGEGAPPLVMATIAADGSDLQPATSSGDMVGLHPRFRPTP